jgi:hypothetical protein
MKDMITETGAVAIVNGRTPGALHRSAKTIGGKKRTSTRKGTSRISPPPDGIPQQRKNDLLRANGARGPGR